jgi:hypothetical protein
MKYSSVSVTVGFFFLLLLGISDLLSLGYETIEVGTFVDLTSRQITPKGPHYLLEHYQIHGGGKCEIQSLYGLNANLTLVALNQTVFGSTKKLWVNASGKCLDEVHRSFYLFSGVGLIVPFLAFLLFLILFGIPPALCPSHEERIIDTALELSTTPPVPLSTPRVSTPRITRPTPECDTPMP